MTPLQIVTESVHVAPDHGRWRTTTTEVLLYWREVEIFIRTGFRFDGASVPFFLWWWVYPWDWWVVLAACVHDKHYQTHQFGRRECDRIFLAILIHKAKQSRWRWLAYRRIVQARIMYRAVRQFGGRYW